MICADDARIACPLFQAEYGGEVPTSALQLILRNCSEKTYKTLVRLWHSRLPHAGSFYGHGMFFTAEFNGIYYATAGWSDPINIAFNGRSYLELRRFAIAPDAPKMTASRLLSLMVRRIKQVKPEIIKLISYQDTEVHKGTIYKASGWRAARISGFKEQRNWVRTYGRPATSLQSDATKIRWELRIK